VNAERAVITARGGDTLLRMLDLRLPDQRTVSKQPDRAGRSHRHGGIEEARIILLVEISEARLRTGIGDKTVAARHHFLG
jgi:hypothetical protein